MATRAIPKAAFSSTAKQWFELTKTTVESDDDGDALEELDRLILGHKPTSDLEIIVLVDVVIEAMRSGGRVDGLEISALLNVRDRVLKDSARRDWSTPIWRSRFSGRLSSRDEPPRARRFTG